VRINFFSQEYLELDGGNLVSGLIGLNLLSCDLHT